jgi:hypothetical protein
VHDTDKRLLSKAIAEYNAEIKAHKSKRTHAAYRLTLSLLQDAINTTYLEDISRKDILTFISALRDDECGRARSPIASATSAHSSSISS